VFVEGPESYAAGSADVVIAATAAEDAPARSKE
jgi:hypothetical protein